MAGNEFLDKEGLSVLWEQIQQLVYECCNCGGGGGGSGVTYRLESDGNVVTLVGSDGTRSSVAVIATPSCEDEPIIDVSVNCYLDDETGILTVEATVTVNQTITGATVVLRREVSTGQYEVLQTWQNVTLTGTTTYTATDTLVCPSDSYGYDRYGEALVFTTGVEPVAEGADTYHFECGV